MIKSAKSHPLHVLAKSLAIGELPDLTIEIISKCYFAKRITRNDIPRHSIIIRDGIVGVREGLWDQGTLLGVVA